MKVLLVGDTHGNIGWLRNYIFPVAMALKVDAVLVLGDFGAWEHTEAGTIFMDDVANYAFAAGLDVLWLHGNHDNWAHTVAEYGKHRTSDGFIPCRENVYYIPQGHTWTWGGVGFRSFGGAYSVDRAWRIDREQAAYRELCSAARHNGQPIVEVPRQDSTLWFPEEEMTDAEMDELLHADSGRKQIVLSHDKPLSAKPDWNRKDIPGCIPNQIRLERALRLHRPQWWFHGHLHYHYTDTVSTPLFQTTIVGLEPDNSAAEHMGWRRENTWILLELADGHAKIHFGRDANPTVGSVGEARKSLTGWAGY